MYFVYFVLFCVVLPVRKSMLNFSVHLDVGMQSGLIPGTSITASSWLGDHRPYMARFMHNHRGWKSSVSGTPQWLQVELNQDELLTHIATLGSFTDGQYSYCKSYKLHYGKSSDAFFIYTENGQPRVSCTVKHNVYGLFRVLYCFLL